MKYFYLFCLLFLSFCCLGQSEQEAEALIANENYEAAIDIYDILATQAIERKDYVKFLQLQTIAAVLYQDMGSYEIAKNLLQESLDRTEDKIVADTSVALVYHKLGVSHYYLEDYNKAIDAWQQALSIRSNYLPPNHNDIAKGYKNLGSAYEKLNDFKTSETNYKKSVDLLLSNAAEERDRALLSDNYRELGFLSALKNDIELAETYYLSAQRLYEELYVDEPWMLGIIYSDVSSFYFDVGLYQKVIEYGEKTIRIYENLEDKYDEDYWAMADAYNNIGIAYLDLGVLQQERLTSLKAIEPLKNAIAINQQFEEARKSYESTNRTNLALVYKDLQDYSKAHEQIEKTLIIGRQSEDQISLAINTNNRGEIYFDQKQYDVALKDFQTAIQLLVSDFDSDDISENPKIQGAIIKDKISLVEILNNKARTLVALKKEVSQQQAISTYDSLFVLISSIQNEVAADESKRFLAAKAKTFFEAAIQVNLAQYQKTQKTAYLARTFELAEQSKAVSLLSQLSESQAKSEANIPSDLLQREQNLKRRIKTLEQNVFEAEKAKQSSVDLRTQLIATNRQLEKLVDTLEQQYATYHDLKYTSTAIPLTTIQQNLLASNQAMIQYFLGDSSLTILYTDRKNSKAIQKGHTKDLLQEIERFRTAIIEQDMDAASYQTQAYALYQLLLEEVLTYATDIQRLVVVPDGVLAYLPFEVLTTEWIKGEDDFRFLPYLLKDYAISYSYSASVLAKQQHYRSDARKYLAAFAPSYENELVENDQLTRLLVRSGNYNLPGALAEVKAVNKLMGGDLFMETEATETLFKEKAHLYKNLHLSMHGIVNDSFPLRSKLLFYEGATSEAQDASLYAYELYNMQLNCDLVVLSACNTGMGQFQKGEGVMSLSHAFAYAGVASTVMSLWQVPDASTATLLQDFYKNLKTDLPKDVAMQQAKLTFLDHTISLKQAHPFYWAALLNYGSQEALVMEKNTMIWVWVLGGLLFGLITVLIYLRNHKLSNGK